MKQYIIGALLGAVLPSTYIAYSQHEADRLDRIEQVLTRISIYTDRQIGMLDAKERAMQAAREKAAADMAALKAWKPKPWIAGTIFNGR